MPPSDTGGGVGACMGGVVSHPAAPRAKTSVRLRARARYRVGRGWTLDIDGRRYYKGETLSGRGESPEDGTATRSTTPTHHQDQPPEEKKAVKKKMRC